MQTEVPVALQENLQRSRCVPSAPGVTVSCVTLSFSGQLTVSPEIHGTNQPQYNMPYFNINLDITWSCLDFQNYYFPIHVVLS